MNKPSLLDDYLDKYSVGTNWNLVSGNIENISLLSFPSLGKM